MVDGWSQTSVCETKYLKRAALGDSVSAREVVPAHQVPLWVELHLARELNRLVQGEVGVARGVAEVRGHDGYTQKNLVRHLHKRVGPRTQGLRFAEACAGQQPWWLCA